MGRKVNRLDLWVDQGALKKYLKDLSSAYPHYVLKSDMHDKDLFFFAVPTEYIEKVYHPREGLRELMNIPYKDLDEHLKTVVELITFLLKSNLKLEDIGITYSTLMGHYSENMSDINIVIYGKEKFWGLMNFLEENEHKYLRWKTYEEWEAFYEKRNRNIVHKKDIYIRNMHRKKSEGFFKDTLFVIFAVENENETWFKWGEEKYKNIGNARFKATIKDNKNSVVRPGCYEVIDSEFIDGDNSCKYVKIKKIVFQSRDYCMLAYPNEKVEVQGMVEKVVPSSGESYYRISVGYFDINIDERKDNEYIKVIASNNEDSDEIKKLFNEDINFRGDCNLCRETFLEIGQNTGYGSILYKIGNLKDGWIATLSPVTGGNPEIDFAIQLMPIAHLTHFSQVRCYPRMDENYGIIFSKACKAMTQIMMKDSNLKSNANEKELAASLATYGKFTTWRDKKEHLHIKIFPFRGNVGQPYTVDSTFGKKEIFKDEYGKEFVKMEPVVKRALDEKRFKYLTDGLTSLFKE
jgi:predicted nucleotidyltransferase